MKNDTSNSHCYEQITYCVNRGRFCHQKLHIARSLPSMHVSCMYSKPIVYFWLHPIARLMLVEVMAL